MKEALLYVKLPDKSVRCHLCAHHCLIREGKRGICRVRENQGGVLYSLVYGKPVAQHIDPIEKKPLFHFYPGSLAYSIATCGCNFHCLWCQNWEISQIFSSQNSKEVNPAKIVATAQESGCQSIAYTYTEPTIFFEYAYDIARRAQGVGLANIYISNGYMSEEMLKEFWPYLDAANVDLKAFRDETYRRYIGGYLQPVLNNLKQIKKYGIWLEVTTLIIPEINDSVEELRDMAEFIVQELGPDTPWHLSRFFPAYKMNAPITPLTTLEKAKEIGLKAGLRYVYEGNIADREKINTYCPNCGRLLIRRSGFSVLENFIQEAHCPDCKAAIAGVGMSEI
ncbi:MAG: AmmeMemoRadiSam system radical SAM enzyme [Candidatus Omnitrophica bacterium]|nr:AmmeMemoRadiSam system radical SAM enzyme [Candidatus Omnitrophota bacterium]